MGFTSLGRCLRLAFALCATLLLANCAQPVRQIEAMRSPGPNARILLMPVDLELAELGIGGVTEPKAEWTERVRGHVTAALRGATDERGRQMVVFQDSAFAAAEEREKAHQIAKLHQAVGQAILVHRVSGMAELPTKKDRFDWTLGPETRTLAKATGADYALFVFLRDSYASAGRVAVIVVGAAFGVGIAGGQQIGFASLVDLESGDVVWFNRLARRVAVSILLTGMPK
jgi:hypothetical protein